MSTLQKQMCKKNGMQMGLRKRSHPFITHFHNRNWEQKPFIPVTAIRSTPSYYWVFPQQLGACMGYVFLLQALLVLNKQLTLMFLLKTKLKFGWNFRTHKLTLTLHILKSHIPRSPTSHLTDLKLCAECAHFRLWQKYHHPGKLCFSVSRIQGRTKFPSKQLEGKGKVCPI